MAALIDSLRRGGPPVVLPSLPPEQVAECLAATLAHPPAAALTAFVTAQTRGVPRYVQRLAAALAGQPRAEEPRIGPAAVAPFAADLDELDHDVRLAMLAVEAGIGLQLDLLGALLERDADGVAELIDAARATGLLGADGALVPLARQAIAALVPVAHRVRVRQRLATLQLARGGPVLPLVRPLLGAGATDGSGTAAGGPTGLAAAFEAGGREALADDPALAARLFAAATTAGRPAAARRALATALAGDLESASRLADQVLAAGEGVELPEAAYVAAVALAHRGQLARSVELFQWAPPGPAAGFAAVGLVGTGRLAEAQAYARPGSPGDEPAGPPTLLSGAAALMARGACESVTGSPTAALSVLVQATNLLEPAGSAVLLPDSPAALAALVALHCAELDIGEVLLDRAAESRMGGPLMVPRHRLLSAWLLMARGRTAAARQRWTAAVDPSRLPARDRLFAAALRIGLARRDSDVAALREAWPEACQALVGHPADLFTMLPLGELEIAAARLGERRRLAAHLAEAEALLHELGKPPLWAVPLHWSRLHAAIIAELPAEAERHASALADHSRHSPYAAAVAAAARSWLAVSVARIDAAAVETAARGLASVGLAWDGARLAGQAAIRTPDRAVMTALLDCARVLQGRPADRRGAAGTTAGRPGGRPGGRAASDPPRDPEQPLSEREQQVADLVLGGLTYKQVGDRLYISAKTVEHHMARIRQRLGCTDRRDLLNRLRAMTAVRAAPAPRSGTGSGK
jgi:DNA-binding NarL/FixJ family response regulator